MESRTTRAFWFAFFDLPAAVRQDAKAAYRLFQENPTHLSLRFRKLDGLANVHSLDVGRGYRALGAARSGRIVWFWIGSLEGDPSHR